MTQRQEEAEWLCNVFREDAETIWHSYSGAMMSLPYHYRNGHIAMVDVRMLDDGRVRVSDDGGAAKNEGLTMREVKRICRKHGLRYETIDDDLTMPLCCDIYRIVERKDFVPAVWDILEAIIEARYGDEKKHESQRTKRAAAKKVDYR